MRKPRFIRTQQEKDLSLKKLELYARKIGLYLLNLFNKWGAKEESEVVSNILRWQSFVMSRPGKRLNASGEMENIMFISINPARSSSLENLEEDRYGKYLFKCLDEAGIDKKKHWFTNLYKYPTEHNRPLTKQQMEVGMEELELEIRAIRPRVIVGFGKQVKETILANADKIDKSIPLVFLNHPSYIQRFGQRVKEVEFIKHLTKIKNLYEKTRMGKENDS